MVAGPGFKSRSGHLSHCVIPLSGEFTHVIAVGQLGLAIPPRVGKNENQLCAAAATDTFLWFTSPELGNLLRKAGVRLRAIEMVDQSPTQWALRSPRVVVVVLLLKAASHLSLINLP